MPMELVTELPYDHPYRWDGTLFGGPKLWQPSDIYSNLELWLDAADLSTVTLNGSNVSQWNDKSGNGRHATQSSASIQPGYTTSQSVNFTTATGSGLKISGLSTWICFVVGSALGTGDWRTLLWSSGNNHPFIVQSSTIDVGAYSSGFFGASGLTWEANVRNLFGIYGDTSNIKISKNGGPQISTGSNVNLVITEIGKTSGQAFGNVNELVFLKASSTAMSIQLVEGYLAWKWKLQANLPSTHPFKNLPPTV